MDNLPNLSQNSPLDAYLNRLTRQLRLLPPKMRSEYREEVRQHLRELAQWHMEHGRSEQEAMEIAMRTFGDPKRVGREIAAEVGWDNGILPGSLPAATLCGIVWLVLLAFINFAFTSLLMSSVTGYFTSHPYRTMHIELEHDLFQSITVLHNLALFVVVPSVAGWMTGYVNPKSAGKGMLFATVGFLVIACPFYFLSYPISSLEHGYLGRFFTNLGVFWCGLGYLSATFSSRRLRGLRTFVVGRPEL